MMVGSSKLFFYLATLLSWLVLVSSDCSGNVRLTEQFGKLDFSDEISGLVDDCSWTFDAETQRDTILVVRFEYRRRRRRGNRFPNRIFDSYTQIRLPGGEEIGRRDLRFLPLNECRKYYATTENSACTNQFLDNYCVGENYKAAQWPPIVDVHPESENYNDFDFQMYYVLVNCPRTSQFISNQPISREVGDESRKTVLEENNVPTSSSLTTKQTDATTTTQLNQNNLSTTVTSQSAETTTTALFEEGEMSDLKLPPSLYPSYVSLCGMLVPVLGAISSFLLVLLILTLTILSCKIRRLKREAKIEDLPKTPNPTSTSFDQGTYLQPINLVTPKRSHPPLPKKPNMESDLELFGQYEEIVERQQLSKHA